HVHLNFAERLAAAFAGSPLTAAHRLAKDQITRITIRAIQHFALGRMIATLMRVLDEFESFLLPGRLRETPPRCTSHVLQHSVDGAQHFRGGVRIVIPDAPRYPEQLREIQEPICAEVGSAPPPR